MPDLSQEERWARGWLYDRGLFVSDLPSAEWINAVDELLKRAEKLAKQLSRAHEDEAIERERAERLAEALRKIADNDLVDETLSAQEAREALSETDRS